MLRQKKQTIGSNLKHHRKSKGLTQRGLAEAAGFNRSYVSHIELDNRLPSLTTLKKLATALGVPWAVLVVE